MKKKILFIVFMLIFTMEAKAQYLRYYVGVKGVGVATMMDTEPKPKGMSFGGGGGALLGLRLGRTLGIQGEFLYVKQGANFGGDLLASTPNYSSVSSDIKLKQTYYHIPITLQLWVSKSFMFEVGVQQSIVGGATMTESSVNGNSVTVDDDGAFNYGSVLAGFSFNMGKIVSVNARYTMGLNESYVINRIPGKTNMIQVGISFRLYTSKRSAFVN